MEDHSTSNYYQRMFLKGFPLHFVQNKTLLSLITVLIAEGSAPMLVAGPHAELVTKEPNIGAEAGASCVGSGRGRYDIIRSVFLTIKEYRTI